jgi:LysM repeat protein
MRFVRATLALLVPTFLCGCGYVHFGRLDKTPAAGGDAALATAYSNLSTEHKILKQELVLARKEGDALRIAMERGTSGTSADSVARLSEATRELAALRASYAKLQAERSTTSAPAAATDAPRLRELEEKLATSLRNYTQLQEENSRLRGEIDRTRGENVALAEQLKTSNARNDQAQHALEMLNVELLAQKQARAKAEQVAESVRAQLNVVLAQGSGGGATGSLASARESSASSTAALQLSRPPTSETAATAELRTNAERLRRAGETPAPVANPTAPRPTVHLVVAGDTLEKIALKYYGTADQWRALYEANTTLLGGGQPLRIGMELQLP